MHHQRLLITPVLLNPRKWYSDPVRGTDLMFNTTVGRLRGFAILAVLLLHYGQYLPLPFAIDFTGFPSNGYYGVIVFFVVSGYLITSTILKRDGDFGSISLPDFYMRRVARIAPLLILFLVFLVATSKSGVEGLAVPSDMSTLQMLWYALTFRFNVFVHWHEGYRVASWLILWSLSIEEMFYLGYPIVCRLLKQKSLILAALLCLIIFGPIDRATSKSLHFALWDYFDCFDSIAMGAVLAILANDLRHFMTPIRRAILRWGGLAGLISTYLFVPMMFHHAIGPLLIGLSACLLIASSLFGEQGSAHWPDPLSFFGAHSYELYLFHMSLIMLIRPWAPATSSPLLCFLGFFTLTTILAILLKRHFSDPMHATVLDLAERRKTQLGVR